ncbi:hypothetical protein Zmor_015390 [Zophobas morio]|uniref:Uncharacterized protein n=1 Tax=Zophobas morio TaxID=2755281 RepID=A0AA38MHP4_9CUCU|nr:hypothetical protein Zmor_015390 [Zophobas morio]
MRAHTLWETRGRAAREKLQRTTPPVPRAEPIQVPRQGLAAIRFGPPTTIGGGIFAPPFLFRHVEKDAGVPAGIRSKLGEVLKCLKEDARTWAMASRDRWSTYEDFRDDFVEFYWPTHQRRAVAEEVRRGHFDPHRDGLMVDYFIKNYGLLKSLILPDSELDILDKIMRVLPDDVWNSWNSIPRRERCFAGAQEFLLGRGSGREHRNSGRGSPHRRRERQSPRRRRRDDSWPHAPVPALPAQAPFNPFSLPPPNTSGPPSRNRGVTFSHSLPARKLKRRYGRGYAGVRRMG